MSRTVRWVSAVLAIALSALLAVSAVGCNRLPTVPDVQGKTLAEAQRLLEQAGYKQGETTRAYSSGVTPGTIFQQYPLPGMRLAKGESVALRIALPPGRMVVPSVVGLPAEEASAAIAGSSLSPKRVDQFSDTVAAGVVTTQVPEPSAQMSPGATVVYVVSSGKAPASSKVPSIVGKSKSDADAAIKGAGLVPDAEQVYSDTVAKDKIVMQMPAAGAVVAPGSTVAYAVSLGKPAGPVTVPNVTGKSESEAVSAIQGAGLVANVYRQSSSTVPKGAVITQMPPAGTKTAKGGTVGIIVSAGSDSLVAVPDVAGKSEAEARSALENAGFVVQAVAQPSDSVPSGSVIAQSPVAASKAPAGSMVIIAVSSGPPTGE